MLEAKNYGSIRFPGSRMAPARWARLPVVEGKAQVRPSKGPGGSLIEGREYAKAVMKLLLKTWELKPPSAVISVLGPWHVSTPDPENVLIRKPDLQPTVKRMLRDIALKINAWVLTRGLFDGDGANVISLVGKAMEETEGRVPCIGLVPWSVLAEQKALADKEGETFISQKTKESKRGAVLAPSHSHYLLIDDGTKNPASAKVVRTALREYISNNDVSGDGIETPVLSIVINGDQETLQMALSALQDDRSPVA
eukprot:554021-Prymnesium_polylepis.1